MTVSERPNLPVSSMIGRVSAVFTALARSQQSMGLAELSRATGIPKTSTYRIAQDLVEAEYLERDGSRYRLGLRLFELGSHFAARSLRNQVLPFLEDLYTISRGTVHFAVRHNDSVIYIEKLHGHNGIRRGSRVAGQLPLHGTATGKAILAFSSAECIEAYLAKPLARLTPYTVVAAVALEDQLREIRQRGWSHERDECVIGYSSVASPILSAEGRAMGALSVTMPNRDLHVPTIAGLVTKASKAVSAQCAKELAYEEVLRRPST